MSSSYDAVPYSAKVHRGRHPDRLIVVAKLLGLEHPPCKAFRLLELGCGTAEHLIPLALEYPDAHFVGIDTSRGEITKALGLIEEFSLKNISLHQYSVETELTPLITGENPRFDFIFCHGMYSWVAPATQRSILRCIQNHLNADGLAMVSYNTFPGWHLREAVRSIVRHYDEPSQAPQERIQRARSVMKLLATSLQYDYERPYSVLLHKEFERIAREPDAYLLHELLNPHNYPVKFSDFLNHLSAYELSYVSDTRFSRQSLNRMLTADIHPIAFKNIVTLASDELALEQTMDFLFFNTFRESIIRRGAGPATREIRPDALRELSFSTHIRLDVSEDAPAERDEYVVVDPRGVSLTITDPRERALVEVLLSSQPQYLPFHLLLSRFQNVSKGDDSFVLAKLIELLQRELVDVAFTVPPVADRVMAHPRTTPFIRKKAAESAFVPNVCFNTVEIGALERSLVARLDGSQDLDALAQVAFSLLASGEAGIKEDGEPITDPEKLKELVPSLVGETLETIKRAGLLLE